MADALSQKTRLARLMMKEWNLLEGISKWNSRLERQKVIFGNITLRLTLLERIKETQKKKPTMQGWPEKVQNRELSISI